MVGIPTELIQGSLAMALCLQEETAYLADVFLDPLQGFDLVSQTVVRTPPFFNLLSGQETIRADTIVEGDHNDAHVRSMDQTRRVVVSL